MSLAEKFEVIADAVYEKGKAEAETEFWNGFTNKGSRQNYYFGFLNTNFDGRTIPEGLCRPRTRLHSMFYQYSGTELPAGIDCSEFDVGRDVSYHAQAIFQYSSKLTAIYDIGIPAQKTYANAFGACTSLETIEVLRSNDNTVWSNTFSGCTALKDLKIEGSIKQNGFNVSDCKQLTHKSLMSIIDALSTTDTKLTVTLGTANLNKLTDAEKAIVTEEKGWTLV